MVVELSEQLRCFAAAVLFGAAAGLVYRIRMRLTRHRGFRADAAADLGYWLLVLPAFAGMILTVCGGELRLYELCGIAAGAGLVYAGGKRKNDEK